MVKNFNPLSAEFQQNPYEAFKYLREQPALYVKELNCWWVGRYDDVRTIATQTAVFSNKKFHEISLGEFDYSPGAANLVASDPPVHTRLRKLVTPAFAPVRLRALMQRVQNIIDLKIDPLIARAGGAFDFQHHFSELIPLEVVALFMGTDVSRAEDFRRWSTTIMSASQRATMNAEQHEGIRRAIAEARAYFLDLIAKRRTEPGADVISDLVRAQEGGDQLTDAEILSLCILLLNGGNGTTAHLLGNVMTCLWNNPEQLEIVRKNPERMGDAVDETLRYESPVHSVFLWATQDVSLGGVEIPADSAVIGSWGSANRDERHFPDPDRFDITREKLGHAAFGFGPHFCVGKMLGRMEVDAALARVLERMPTLRRAETGPIDWVPSYWLRGPRALPVVL